MAAGVYGADRGRSTCRLGDALAADRAELAAQQQLQRSQLTQLTEQLTQLHERPCSQQGGCVGCMLHAKIQRRRCLAQMAFAADSKDHKAAAKLHGAARECARISATLRGAGGEQSTPMVKSGRGEKANTVAQSENDACRCGQLNLLSRIEFRPTTEGRTICYSTIIGVYPDTQIFYYWSFLAEVGINCTQAQPQLRQATT